MALLLSLALLGCGGGNSNSPGVSPTPSIQEPTWIAGQFSDAAIYKNLCAQPRTGPDSNGDTFLDAQGTAMHEKMWLRSWSNDSYLWYSEVDDNNPSLFSVADYFKQLKTNQTTQSGSLKDNFHFSDSTESYNQRTQSGVTSGYGITWEFVNDTAPRRLLVRYTEPGSPAALAAVNRGYELQSLNGIDFINTTNQTEVDQINAVLFPEDSGQTHNFIFSDSAGNQVLATQLTSANIELQPVQNTQVLNTNIGRMGYMQFNSFIRIGQQGLVDSFQQFVDQGITELVIDLRYNGGGLLAMASQLAFMVAGNSQTNNQTFETLQFNDKYPNVDPITGNTINPTPFYSREINWATNQLTNVNLPSVSLTRVFILATDSTCSASEAVINGLRGIDIEVILIGDTTCGKPFGFYAQDNCSTTYFNIQFQGINAKGFGEYSDGFIPTDSPIFSDQLPGCVVADDFTNDLGNANEALLSAAISYAETGECPTINNSITEKQSFSKYSKTSIKQSKDELDLMLHNNKIYIPIKDPQL